MSRRLPHQTLDVALVAVALLLLWYGLSLLIGTATVPSPLQAAQQLWKLLWQTRFQRDLAATAQAYGLSLLFAMAGGLALGILCGGWRAIGQQIEPVMLVLIATPKVMLYPLILLFFGLGDAAKIIFGLLHGLPPVVIMTANALRTIPPIYRKAARTLRMSNWAFAVDVLVPAVLPEIIASFRVCFSLTLLGVLVGEMFASTRGLGHLLIASIGTNDQPTIMAITLLLFAFAGIGSSVLLALSGRSQRAEPPMRA
ncbi:MAG: ABC transporter permease [Xanthobacteraceae bacterium]